MLLPFTVYSNPTCGTVFERGEKWFGSVILPRAVPDFEINSLMANSTSDWNW